MQPLVIRQLRHGFEPHLPRRLGLVFRAIGRHQPKQERPRLLEKLLQPLRHVLHDFRRWGRRVRKLLGRRYWGYVDLMIETLFRLLE